MTREVVVVAGVRTAVGDFGGSLKDFSPTQLGAMVVKEVVPVQLHQRLPIQPLIS